MPKNLVKTVDSSVQGIRSVVLCQRVLHSVQREFTIGDTVAVTSNHRAKIRALAEIALQGVEAQGHVAWVTLAIRHDEGNDNTAIVSDSHFHAVCIAEYIKEGLPAIRQFPEALPGNLCCAL